jgi:hypothetical protein
MTTDRDPALVAMFGSRTRLLTLAVLASADEPLTGYRVAEVAGLPRQNVYPELRRGMMIGMIEKVAEGFRLTDHDVRALLQKRVPISFQPNASAVNRLYRRLEALPPPKWDGLGPIRYNLRRRREKDELLAKRGMRPSVTYGPPGVRKNP